VHIQLTHRTIALFLVLHLIGMVIVLRKRRASEAVVVVRAADIALGMVLLQLVVASAMILFHLPPVLRSLHEATGVGIWLSCFTLAYLAHRSSRVVDEVAPAPATSAPASVSPASVPPSAATIAPPTMAVIVARGADVL
jgi:heme A synthase